MALGFPETSEGEHMGHPDFRVRGKIFATLWPGDVWGMVKLTADQQASFVQAEPHVFEPVNGAWGRRGATKINLPAAQKASVSRAMAAAWRKTAPKRLVQQHDE